MTVHAAAAAISDADDEIRSELARLIAAVRAESLQQAAIQLAERKVAILEMSPGEHEPSQDQVEEYAAWLGLDLEQDADLLWIARTGLKALPPAPWKACQSESGDIFYFNFETGESMWEHPCDEHIKQLHREVKARKDGQFAPPPRRQSALGQHLVASAYVEKALGHLHA
eukprot:TRINITY_DN1135_c0_g1_i1.p1 TRINITY_DN1135_c0_g1~~TRINITY_DN1135_c0_g1_i1.p1  ORF type:complete len:186 (+),score=47.84 TRINITY_DN1135_c0_g1_i1:50-559(+)